MVARVGAQLALFGFCVAVLTGLLAGNDVTTIVIRALLVMVVSLLAGQLVGWVGKVILRDHLQKRKLAIDLEHLEALSVAGPQAAIVEDDPVAEPDTLPEAE